MSKGMLAALVLSIVLAISLSFLPDRALEQWGGTLAGSDDEARDVPVMKMDGVVDVLGQMTLSSRIQRVSYEKQRLTVWLSVPKKQLLQSRPYEDMYKIAHRFLAGAPDYREVEVRVVSLESPEAVQYSVALNTKDMIDAPRPDTPEATTFVKQKINASVRN